MPNPNQLSAVAELPSPAGALPGLAARIGSTIGDAIRNGYESLHNGYETARHNPRTYLAIGATAFAGTQAAELALNTEPADGEGVPALSAEPFDADSALVPWAVEQHPYMGPGSASASASSLKQQCATDIFKQPQIIHNEMTNPGERYQSFFIQLGFGPVNAACNGRFKRLAYVKPQLKRHGHIINEYPIWSEFLTEGDTNEASHPGTMFMNSGSVPELYYRKGDKPRFQLRLQEYSLPAHKIVKTTIRPYLVRIER